MKIMFIGTTAVHHVLIGAYFFLQSGKRDDILTAAYGFGDIKMENRGMPIYIGTKDETEVYVLGVGNEIKMAEKTLNELIVILGFSKSDLLVVPIYVKGEWLISLVAKLPAFLGFVANGIVKSIIKGQIELIYKQTRVNLLP